MVTAVMVDLETLSTESNAAILSIGAVSIDLDAGTILDKFYMVVDPQSSLDAGLHVSGSTIKWWLTQSEEARKGVAELGVPLQQALEEFSRWMPKGATVWGNGATLDNVVLTNAYRAVGLERPWSFRDDRCYRTIKNLYLGVPTRDVGVAHHALDDAEAQALHLIDIWQVMVKETQVAYG